MRARAREKERERESARFPVVAVMVQVVVTAVVLVATARALSQLMKNGQVDENRTTTLPDRLRCLTPRSTIHLSITCIRTEFVRLGVDLVGVCVV